MKGKRPWPDTSEFNILSAKASNGKGAKKPKIASNGNTTQVESEGDSSFPANKAKQKVKDKQKNGQTNPTI